MHKLLILLACLVTLHPAPTLAEGKATGALNYSIPFKTSISVGTSPWYKRETLTPLIQGEVGQGGGKFSLGLANYEWTMLGGTGYGYKFSFLKTFEHPSVADKDTNYIGIEAEVLLAFFNFQAGAFRPHNNDGTSFLRVGVGFGF